MGKLVILVIFLIIFSSISFAKVVDVPRVSEGEEIPMPFVQEEEIIRYYYSGNSLIKSSNGEEEKYYFQDRLGSNRVSIDLEGEVSNFKSLPYGQAIQDGIQYGFTGKEEDESGLYYFGARYYDPDLGRFTSVDPVAENEPYSYVGNNPMMFVDPTGMVEERPIAVMMYNSNSPEFKEEVGQYMSNYKYDYEFWLYGVNGYEEVSSAFNEINQQIEEGREVARVNYFDHRGSVMFGMDAEGWRRVSGLESSSDRCVIMGTCRAGNKPSGVLKVMTEKAGASSYYGTDGAFHGISRYPVENDFMGLLSTDYIFESVTFSDINDVSFDSIPRSVIQRLYELALSSVGEPFSQGYSNPGEDITHFLYIIPMDDGLSGEFHFDHSYTRSPAVYLENIIKVDI